MDVLLKIYFDTIVEEKIHDSPAQIQFYLESLFTGIDFKDKHVLDIGGGFGLLSFYAAVKGARSVVCIEPESSGSTSGTLPMFDSFANRLNLKNVSLVRVTFQDYPTTVEKFDIIISHNSINHLDEIACINLLKDDSSKAKYREIFKKISLLTNQDAKLIICDCSRYNFFAFLKLRNPYSPTIEWHKHQKPETWSKMLEEVGFAVAGIRWKNNDKGIYIHKKFSVSKVKSFFLHSHFCILATKI